MCVCTVKITTITATAPCGGKEGGMCEKWEDGHVMLLKWRPVREGWGWEGRCDVGQEGQERTYPCRPLLLFSC